MNNQDLKNIRNSSIWKQKYKDLDDFMENGFFKSDLFSESSKVITNIVRTGDIIKTEGEKFFKEFNVSLSQKTVLEALYLSGKDYMTQQELSSFVYTSKANISSLLTRMEKKNLINRVENKENKREKKVCLTKQGEQLLLKILSIMCSNNIEKVIITEKEAKTLNQLLNKLRHNFKNIELVK